MSWKYFLVLQYSLGNETIFIIFLLTDKTASAISHSKIMIIDEQKIITGSFNFSDAAQQRNAENLLIITGDPPLVEQYIENWKDRKSQSDPYTPKVEE